MKEINLPVTTTFSMTVDLQGIKVDSAQMANGQVMIPLGAVDFGKNSKDIDIARINGGKILYATTTIEKKLESVISNYLFGLFLEPDSQRSFFEHEILGSSDMGFKFKKSLVTRIIDEENFVLGKQKTDLVKKLTDIMNWRNAFAHGDIRYDNIQGIYLNYYSGGNKQQELTDAFWDKVMDVYTSCTKNLNDILDKVARFHIDKSKEEK